MKTPCDRQNWTELKSSRNGTQIGEQSVADEERKKFPLLQLVTDPDLQLTHQQHQGNRSGAGRIPLNLTDPMPGAIFVQLPNRRIPTAPDLTAEAVAAAPTLNVIGAATETHEETTANAIGMIETVVAETKPEALPPVLRHASEKRKKTLLDGCLNQLVLAEAKR